MNMQPILSQDETRRKALAFQAEMQKRRDQAMQITAGGRAGRGGSPGSGQKNRNASAAARAPEATPPEIPESRRTKPSRKENEFMMNLMILRNTLLKNAPSARERAKLAGKYVWRDIRLMLTLVDKTQERMLATMPEGRRDYYSAYAQHGHYELHIDGAVRSARHLLVTDKHLAAITEAAMRGECALCLKDGKEARRCPIREALLEAAPPDTLADEDAAWWGGCEYQHAASQLMQGEDITL